METSILFTKMRTFEIRANFVVFWAPLTLKVPFQKCLDKNYMITLLVECFTSTTFRGNELS